MRTLTIKSIETGEVLREIDVTGKSDSHVEKAMSGLLRQMDTDRYYIADSADGEE